MGLQVQLAIDVRHFHAPVLADERRQVLRECFVTKFDDHAHLGVNEVLEAVPGQQVDAHLDAVILPKPFERNNARLHLVIRVRSFKVGKLPACDVPLHQARGVTSLGRRILDVHRYTHIHQASHGVVPDFQNVFLKLVLAFNLQFLDLGESSLQDRAIPIGCRAPVVSCSSVTLFEPHDEAILPDINWSSVAVRQLCFRVGLKFEIVLHDNASFILV
mmetsp:Transcript_195/g.819  ORF Transcript_195/g.819 Transcript_195/m.819 type:complete len:217 (+) Transcript_195:1405-2055(+)